MKRIAIIGEKSDIVVASIVSKLSNVEINYIEELNDTFGSYDLTICTKHIKNKEFYNNYNVLCSHYSLLPAFDSDEPVRDAILDGVKVTGITVFFTNPKRIIAQYPIFINNDIHYDELEMRMKYIEQMFFPLVVEKIVKNEMFESQYLMQSFKCSNNCGECHQCSHKS